MCLGIHIPAIHQHASCHYQKYHTNIQTYFHDSTYALHTPPTGD
jgi:hypothetical protein